MKKIISLIIVLACGCATAQNARVNAMGGVLLPDRSSAVVNPAYTATGTSGPIFELPLPVGALNLMQDSFNPSSNAFDILPIFDQLNSLDTYIFNLPSSPDVIDVSLTGDEQGAASIALGIEGGSDLLFGLADLGYGVDFSLPIIIPAGPVSVGARPYAFVNGVVSPDANMQQIFAGGTNEGGLTANVVGEAGVTLDVFYAAEVPVELFGESASSFDGDIYFGVRGAPFIGLARIDGSGQGLARVDTSNGITNLEADLSYSGEGFLSSVATGQIGYGAVADFGIATAIPVDNATASFGFGVTNMGLAVWSGSEYQLSGDQTNLVNLSTPTETSRVYFSPNFGVHVNGAYDMNVAPLINILIAADAGYALGSFQTHLGSEALFGIDENFSIAARAGVGFENGFNFALGTGVNMPGVSLDLALTSHIAPFTSHRSFGVTTSLGF